MPADDMQRRGGGGTRRGDAKRTEQVDDAIDDAELANT